MVYSLSYTRSEGVDHFEHSEPSRNQFGQFGVSTTACRRVPSWRIKHHSNMLNLVTVKAVKIGEIYLVASWPTDVEKYSSCGWHVLCSSMRIYEHHGQHGSPSSPSSWTFSDPKNPWFIAIRLSIIHLLLILWSIVYYLSSMIYHLWSVIYINLAEISWFTNLKIAAFIRPLGDASLTNHPTSDITEMSL